jgi:hypothetical protein
MKLCYKEGTWFAVPLQPMGYAVGRVARHAKKGVMILAYFFGPRRNQVPALHDLNALQPHNAIQIWRVGDPGLVEKTWPIIGDLPVWERDRWRTPLFIRKVDVGRTAWCVTRSDDDPSKVLKEERIPYDTSGVQSDTFYGHKAAELALSHILPLG